MFEQDINIMKQTLILCGQKKMVKNRNKRMMMGMKRMKAFDERSDHDPKTLFMYFSGGVKNCPIFVVMVFINK